MALTLVFANADINSRAASTCPYYYWTIAVILSEIKN